MSAEDHGCEVDVEKRRPVRSLDERAVEGDEKSGKKCARLASPQRKGYGEKGEDQER